MIGLTLTTALLATLLSFRDDSLVNALFNFQRSKMGAGGAVKAAEKDPNDYGVDVSTQIHGNLDLNTYHGQRYVKMLSGCYKKYSRAECDGTEKARVRMNLNQAQTQHNYTKIGFLKMRAPDAAWKALSEFYNTNKGMQKLEDWPSGNTYVNHWESPSYMVSLEDSRLRGFGAVLKKQIWDGVRPVIEEWTGKKLKETSMYGVRVYKEGAILATHLDRLPLVSSCIINVDQDLDEPWPLEVYDHNGKAHNVTMQPGDMVLYESHTVLHGRPFPLKGRHFSNLFIHFIPLDHDQVNAMDKKLHPDAGKRVGGHEGQNHDAEELAHGDHYSDAEEGVLGTPGQTELHRAAQRGDYGMTESILNSDKKMINTKDANGWTPFHEAVHAGHVDIAKLLVSHGANINVKSNNGGTPLWWARGTFDEEDHPMIAFLESIDALDEGETEDL